MLSAEFHNIEKRWNTLNENSILLSIREYTEDDFIKDGNYWRKLILKVFNFQESSGLFYIDERKNRLINHWERWKMKTTKKYLSLEN